MQAPGIGKHQVIGHVPAGAIIMKWPKQSLAFVLSSSLLAVTAPVGCAAATAPPADAAQQSSEQLDQILAPIALYPDALIAQILAASADPIEIVEADRWLQQHASLNGTALAQEVDKQTWDPSVKALMQFPSVLQNMDQNLAWTSALGDANASQPQAVMTAIQVMRRRAENAGTLKSTSQETVTTQGQTVVIQPANPDVIYLPEYDPWIVYGAAVGVYPNWDPYPGLYLGGPGYAFGLGIGIGLFAGFGWGWSHWSADWHGGRLLHDHRGYIGHGTVFRHEFYHGHAGLAHAAGFHGFSPHAPVGSHSGGFHSGGFHGFDRAGVAHAYAARGTMGFGGGFHGGFHAGGFHGGGRH
jgi:hypothetical protein